jgi:hypothetical protein
MKNARLVPAVLSVAMIAVVVLALPSAVFATAVTNAHPIARVTKKIDTNKRSTLYGHLSTAVRAATDLGRQDPKTPSLGMIMVLKSSEDQKREIRKLVDEQQDKRTANYHQWVTPEEFGEHFGVHDDDITQVKTWLTSQGFTVDEVSKSKRVIRFSGNLGQVEKAFQTEMHAYNYNGEMHVSNNSEISVPEALNKVIAGVSLHNFYRKGSFERYSRMKLGPKFTSSSTSHLVGPTDFATIYNTAPLLAAGINGTGSSIAVVGRSDILMSDVEEYRQITGLPVNDPVFIHAGQDNGTEPGDDGESDLDVEISGGIAPNAKMYFVIGTPTFLVDGITNSVQYIVENNLADIMSISYGSCEGVEGVGGNEFNNQAFEQAAAQGISVFIASGDNGPAECDDQNDTWENLGYASGAESSTPYSIGVGGTEFSKDGTNSITGTGTPTTYWATSNNQPYLSSAIEYIPEFPWNDAKLSTATDVTGSGLSGLWSSSGGISAYYLQPSWQQGPGITGTDPAFTQGGDWVTGVSFTNGGGSGYTSAPTVTFTGGGCTQEPAASTTISAGSVTGIVFNYGVQGGTLANGQGIGCTSAPTVAFGAAPGGGTTATGTATIGPMENTLPLISGVPHRLVPDVALNASASHDGTLFCTEGVCAEGNISAVGGTSVAAPSMAGIQALINQANGGRQGMPGYIYYALAAAQNTTACNSATLPGSSSSCAFQDITQGNTLICGTSTCTTASHTQIGWQAGPGYDLTTGLGSVNAYNLATQWKNVVFNSSATTLNLSQTTGISHGSSVTLSGTVSGSAGTPTGDVAFIVSQGEIGIAVNPNTGGFAVPGAFATLSGGNYTANLSNLPAGTYNVQARYAGDTSFGSSLSAPVQVTVSAEPSTITITPGSINQSSCVLTTGVSSFTYGGLADIEVSVAGVSGQGVPTGSVTITVDGTSYGTETLDPDGNGHLIAGAINDTSCLFDYMYAQSPTIPGGPHSISATYSGDATFNATTATPVNITVAPISTTPTLTVGAALITTGFADQLTATFAANAAVTVQSSATTPPFTSGPTGTVTFTDTTTSTVLGTASVVPTVTFTAGSGSAVPTYTYQGMATLSSSAITAAGANNITASYSGDSNYAATASAAATVTVGTGTATTTVVTSSGNPTTLGGRPTFTATMTGAPTTGTVAFYDGVNLLGTGTVGTAHTATFRPASTFEFVGGTHSITATFGGSATFMASTSAPFIETVTKGAGAVDLAGKTVGTVGQTYLFQAVFIPSPSSTAYAPILGVMTFFDGGTPIGTSPMSQIASSLGGQSTWTAEFAATSLAAGTHTITASYNDVNYTSATSAVLTVNVSTASVGIYSPIAGTTLSNTGSTTFQWFPVAGAQYWLDIGSAQGAHDYLSSGVIANHPLSLAIANNILPTNGSPVWARLYWLQNGTWQFADSSYTSFGSSSKGVITSPPPNSTLSGSSVTFTWSGAAGATSYWVDAGSSVGGHQYYSSGSLGNVLTTTVNGLPTDGSTVYITLYTLQNGNWLNNGYTYTAFNLGASGAVMTSPTPGSTFTSSTVTFNWTAGAGATAYWIDVGSTTGAHDYYSSGNLGNVTTLTVNGLPTDGSNVYVTLYSLIGGTWTGNTYQYFALNATGGLAAMQTPVPNSTLSGSTVTFTWSSDANATGYWLDIGSTAGAHDYYSSGNLGTALNTTVSSLPADGSTIYVTLYSYVGGQWLNNQYTYTSGP